MKMTIEKIISYIEASNISDEELIAVIRLFSEIERNLNKLSCLEAYGIDNWSEYNEAMEEFYKNVIKYRKLMNLYWAITKFVTDEPHYISPFIECSQQTLDGILNIIGKKSFVRGKCFLKGSYIEGLYTIIINNDLEFGKCIIKVDAKEVEDIEISILN